MKKRLDVLLFEKKLAESREKAKAFILEGKVFVNGNKVDKAGSKFTGNENIEVRGIERFVSRGGLKLEYALKNFNINTKDKICLDIGASTGGFTDCLLQNNASKVYAVDVGYGQLHWKLRTDHRVTLFERCNFRHFENDKLPAPVDIVVIDVSFISLKKIIPKALEFLKEDGDIVALIKPQFEVGRGEVGKGGIVKDSAKHQKVIDSLTLFFKNLKLYVKGIVESPVLGQKGNKEFLIHLIK